MATVSKNQRSHPKQVSRPHLCSKGHVAQRVLVAPGGKGRARFHWACPCTPEINPVNLTAVVEKR